MFYTPLRRDPLIIGWVVVMLIAACVALDTNTTWSGHLESRRVALFLADTLVAFLCSLAVVLFLAWLRSLGWDVPVTGLPRRVGARRATPARPGPSRPCRGPTGGCGTGVRPTHDPRPAPRAAAAPAPPITCRHGAPLDEAGPAGFPPVLRSLAVSHAIVRPGPA